MLNRWMCIPFTCQMIHICANLFSVPWVESGVHSLSALGYILRTDESELGISCACPFNIPILFVFSLSPPDPVDYSDWVESVAVLFLCLFGSNPRSFELAHKKSVFGILKLWRPLNWLPFTNWQKQDYNQCFLIGKALISTIKISLAVSNRRIQV